MTDNSASDALKHFGFSSKERELPTPCDAKPGIGESDRKSPPVDVVF
jgi:hypothetical protein